jgi:hypothetical protein
MQNFYHNIGFWEKLHFFRRKLSKIAENCDHNIDPRPIKVLSANFGRNGFINSTRGRSEDVRAGRDHGRGHPWRQSPAPRVLLGNQVLRHSRGQRPLFYVAPRGEMWPLGVKLTTRGEHCPLGPGVYVIIIPLEVKTLCLPHRFTKQYEKVHP